MVPVMDVVVVVTSGDDGDYKTIRIHIKGQI